MKIICPKCQSQYEAPWFIQANKDEQYHCPVCSNGQERKVYESQTKPMPSRQILKD